jgi:protease-4
MFNFKKNNSNNHQVALIKVFGEINENNMLIEHALHTIQMLKSTNIHALILHVSGTGGTISVAQELSAEIRTLANELPCKIFTYIGESAFSASLYLALAGDKVFCQPGSLIGSIGAIIKHKNFEEFYKKIGISQEVISSSIQKDLFSTSRTMSAIEKESLNVVVQDIHTQFIEWIELRRNINTKDKLDYFDGRIFTGKVAKSLGLVDQFSSVPDILNKIRSENNFENLPDLNIYEPKLVTNNPLQLLATGLKAFF